MQPISFEVHLIDKCGNPVVVTLPIGPAIEVCAFSENAVVKLVPIYGMSTLPSNSDKD